MSTNHSQTSGIRVIGKIRSRDRTHRTHVRKPCIACVTKHYSAKPTTTPEEIEALVTEGSSLRAPINRIN